MALATPLAQAAGLPAPQLLPGQPMLVGSQVLLMWLPVPGAASYVVYHNGIREAAVAVSQHLTATPKDPGEHRYQVAAVDAQGREGERSAPGLLRIRSLKAPAGLSARPDSAAGTIGLVWNQSEGAALYNVYRALGGERPTLIASVRDPTYTDGSPQGGVAYQYTVTARDVTGAESPPSTPTVASVDRRSEAPLAQVVFRALSTTEDLSIDRIGLVRLDQVSYLGLDPGGRVWVITPKTRQIHCLDENGDAILTWGPYTHADTGLRLLPQKLDFGPGGNLYVTDAINSALACIDPAGNLLWVRRIMTPPPTLQEVWKGLPSHLPTLPPTPSSVACLAEEIWVTDQRFQLIYRFGYDGNLRGYLTSYQDGEKIVRLLGVGEVIVLGEGRTLFTLPLGHVALTIDGQGRRIYDLGTQAKGYVGGFVGIHGAQRLPDNRVLLTDPAVGSLQVFDAKTGAYLYHVSGPEPRRDPNFRDRADLPIKSPNLAIQDRSGRFWVYSAFAKCIVVRRPKGEVTPPM